MLESRQSVPSWFLVWPLFLCTLNSCHKFSIGLRSGDSAGVFNQLMAFSSMNSFACLDVCFWSLIYDHQGILLQGRIEAYSLKSWYAMVPFIFPSKMQIAELLRQLIPAPTWTFGGCLTLEKMCVHTCTWRKRHYNFKKATVKKISFKYIISARCQ